METYFYKKRKERERDSVGSKAEGKLQVDSEFWLPLCMSPLPCWTLRHTQTHAALRQQSRSLSPWAETSLQVRDGFGLMMVCDWNVPETFCFSQPFHEIQKTRFGYLGLPLQNVDRLRSICPFILGWRQFFFLFLTSGAEDWVNISSQFTTCFIMGLCKAPVLF